MPIGGRAKNKGFTERQRNNRMKTYVGLRREGLTHRAIAKKWGLDPDTLTMWKYSFFGTTSDDKILKK